MENFRDKIAIVGIGETEHVRRSDRGAKALIIEAVKKALDDAKITPQEVDGIITCDEFAPYLLPHLELSYYLGMQPRFRASVLSAGGGNVGSPLFAAQAITSGQANVVLTYYSNNFGSAGGFIYGEGRGGIKGSFEIPYGCSGSTIQYPMVTHRYMHEYGLTTRQLGSIAVNQRRNAVLNGKGMMKKPMSYEDYENCPMVSDPLRLFDYCQMNDGACAWVMTSAERAKDCPQKPVYVMGTGVAFYPMGSDDNGSQLGDDYIHWPADGQALDRALQMAGIARDDLDFAQIYDGYSIHVLMFLENLGFCKKGEAGAFAESGAISLEGSLPVNTNGGQLSYSYLHKASDMVESVRQLRGEAGACQVRDAEIGMIHGGTGKGEGAVTILRKG